MEKPTLYGWLFKIAIVVAAVVLGYLCVIVDHLFPKFKETMVFRYMIIPVMYLVGFAMVFLLIL